MTAERKDALDILNHDAERDARCGVPEVVYGEGKSAEDLAEIASRILKRSGRVSNNTD